MTRLSDIARTILGDKALGRLDYYRHPEWRASWGGPFNGQHHRCAIFAALVQTVSPEVILETGTFRGTTTEFMARTGLPVRTVERDARVYGFACERLRKATNVSVQLGDSRSLLDEWLAKEGARYKGATALVYLDAHWNDDLPLEEEINIVFENCKDAVVLIDDFKVEDDAEYGYDEYATGLAINRDYIQGAIERFKLLLLYPSLPGAEESGARRGCAVLVRSDSKHAEKLKAASELRPA